MVGRGVSVATVPTSDHMGSCHFLPPQDTLNNLFPVTAPAPHGPGAGPVQKRTLVSMWWAGDVWLTCDFQGLVHQSGLPASQRGRTSDLLMIAGCTPVVVCTAPQVVPE